ncbi:MAG: dihydroorotate dehydrogenase electron transfer subunit [Candidatus Omnitrophica bacterium]|nr:dihydroorotate dehydrogenase electron transfer subunit [Candidatus Omnitrophota bacterium]MCB9719649.1 dihydroorotate dehydrogenase electron transfer subunit [Candidatus Omnitrophota bacterium]
MPELQNIYTVVSNEKLCPAFHRLCFDAPAIRDDVRAGQFVHIRTNAQGYEPFFRRPFSVYRAQKHIEVFYEVVGPGTGIMSQWKKGDRIDVLGPVGTPFSHPPEGIKQVVMVAGGIGVAPFLILSDELKKRGLQLVLLYGGRSGDHVYEMKEFKANGCEIHVATNDGAAGVKGFVSEHFDKIDLNPQSTMVYTCGPHAMMHAVQQFTKKHKLRAQAACEEIMACALGACLGCSIRTTKGFRTVCYDGPVFDLQEIIFD